MKSAVEQMAFYEAYHKNKWNKVTHYFGIPLIVFALLVLLSWPAAETEWGRLGVSFPFVVSLLVYYAFLDVALAAAMTVFVLPVLLGANAVAGYERAAGLAVFAGTFVAGVILQLVGHFVFEKRRPALFVNLVQMFVGPLYFVAQVLFAMGFKRELRVRILEHELKNRKVYLSG